MARDYYEVLGVNRQATETEIKRAFKRMAIKYHPDRNQDDKAKERFKEANEAYQVLSDASLRRIYDIYGFMGVEKERNKAQDSQHNPFTRANDNIDEILRDIYEKRNRRYYQQQQHAKQRASQGYQSYQQYRQNNAKSNQGAKAGKDMFISINIDFKDALNGALKEVSFKALCPCPHCLGSGIIKRAGYSFSGTQCSYCGGDGRLTNVKRLKISIPPHSKNGDVLLCRSQGEAGVKGGPSGDLRVSLNVQENPHFTVDNEQNLHYQAFISVSKAALGGKIAVPAYDGSSKFMVSVPKGSQNGSTLRIPHKGVDNQGDLYIHLQIVIPQELTARQQELFEQLEQELGTIDKYQNINNIKSELAKIKDKSFKFSDLVNKTKDFAQSKIDSAKISDTVSNLTPDWNKIKDSKFVNNVGSFFKNLRENDKK